MLSHSVDETHKLATQLAAQAKPGEVIALFGDLGSGKTTFVQGFCAACGVASPITSPTFTLMHIYRGRQWPIYHFDFYRLLNVAEAQALGCEEYFDGDGVSLVEWPERALALLPPQHWQVHLRIPDFFGAPNVREIKIHRANMIANLEAPSTDELASVLDWPQPNAIKSHTQSRRDAKAAQSFSWRHLCVFASLREILLLFLQKAKIPPQAEVAA